MRMIIVGASGLIGRHLLAAAQAGRKDVLATAHSRLSPGFLPYDICRDNLGAVVGGLKSQDIVFLLSAYTHVGWIFANQDKAARLNVHATKRLIDEANEAGARIVFMSSVEVFDGEKGLYNENDKPRPLSCYGRMKWEIEKYLLEKKCPCTIVRTGWNVGWDTSSPCVVKLTYETLLKPGAQMAHDNIFSVIDVNDTAQGLLKLMDKPEITICHLVSAPGVTRTDLAAMVMKFSRNRARMSFTAVPFADIPYPEKRSRATYLDNSFAVNALGMRFKLPEEIIRRKVELLDKQQQSLSCRKIMFCLPI